MIGSLEGARFYGIVDLGYVPEERVEGVTRELIAGGAGIVQLRAKGYEESRILEWGRAMLPICREAGVPFVVNDFVGVAVELGTDGVHLGQDDGSLAEARAALPEGAIVGRSTHSVEQARGALVEGADYIGFGPLFPTPTKVGRPGIGLENLASVQEEVGARIPVFCIGGIKRANLEDVVRAGAKRVVVVSDVLTAGDVAGAVGEVLSQL
ncbi:MAG: thiamine phosphate synthase [Verrucomicrobiota bacterium]